LFDVDAPGECEAFFAGNVAVISPLHGTPVAYSLKTGRKIRDLEQDAYLTYFTYFNDYFVSEYISADGERYGLLLDASDCQALAYLPRLTDTDGETLLFDIKTGALRRSRLYTVDELVDMAYKELSTR
jgi:hypothetical protein